MKVKLSQEHLTAWRWSLGEQDRSPWSASMLFLPRGRIGGYSSPNEVYWSLDNSVLRIFRSNRQEMWRFDGCDLVDGRLQATAIFQASSGLGAPCQLTQIEKRHLTSVTEADVTASRWSLAEEGKPPWSSSLFFLPGGGIGGYSSPNEVSWSLNAAVLRIFRANRQEMWRFDDFELIDGKRHAIGSCQAEPDVDMICRLTELESPLEASPAGTKEVATERQLSGSRWSLGEAGEAPWSASVYFLRNGRIGGYKSSNETYWSFEQSQLRIFSDARQEIWRFGELATVDGQLQAIGHSRTSNGGPKRCVLIAESKFGIAD